MFTQFDPHSAHTHKLSAVHSQGVYSCSSYSSQANQFSFVHVPEKMISPLFLLGMKEGYSGLCLWVKGCQTHSFITVAGGAGKAKIG